MASLDLGGRTALVLTVFLFLLIHTLPLQAEELTAKPEEWGSKKIAAPKSGRGVIGVATYYANKYNGRRTSSGERYRPNKMTAAHPTLPLGTRVRVVNLTNQREVEVRINDRCRPRSFPLIDVSREAAERLGFIKRGVIPVEVVTIEEDNI
ncbi:MAG: septal ring lytic transglycosylase RlpA family protein [Deltaproteobacteria bacterium]|jgi:rare lipoprotein A|nr:septal ring lytic transglycosylase RlpA family protein [Deltaproteobacteria bacterium]